MKVPERKDDSPEERFWTKVQPTGFCWEWDAVKTHGYGYFTTGGRKHRAHRYAWELLMGPIPEQMTLDHLCRNRACVNPDHLEPVTQKENNRRARAVMTHCKRGHEFTPGNTYRHPVRQSRSCRACHAQSERERYVMTSG